MHAPVRFQAGSHGLMIHMIHKCTHNKSQFAQFALKSKKIIIKIKKITINHTTVLAACCRYTNKHSW